MTTSPTFRRVITAQTKDGKNVFAVNERVESLVSDGARAEFGQQIWQIWGTDGIPQLPYDATEGYANTLFAPPGGYRIQFVEFPGEGGSALVPRGEWPQFGTTVVRHGEVEGGRFGSEMHHTGSVDVFLVLEGEIGFELAGGDEVTLQVGDVLVQNGAVHAWKQTSAPCRLFMVALGSERSTNAG